MKNVVLVINEFKPFTGEHIRLIKKARNLGDVVACIPEKDIDTIEILRELSGVHTIESGENIEDLYFKYKDEGIIYCVNPSEREKVFCKKKCSEYLIVLCCLLQKTFFSGRVYIGSF